MPHWKGASPYMRETNKANHNSQSLKDRGGPEIWALQIEVAGWC